MGIAVVLIAASATGDEEESSDARMYRVTIQNLASRQPLSPPTMATHKGGMRLFKIGEESSFELEMVARDGDNGPLFDLLSTSGQVFEVVDFGMPLTPGGTTVGDFTDASTLMIRGRSGDRLSVVSMLVCTNDGFVGLDRVTLPDKGSSVFTLHGFDAGAEDNTERSADIVDPCSDLGPFVLNGDPNGNENAAVETVPRGRIKGHRGVFEIGDLESVHQFPKGVAKVTITRVSDFGSSSLLRSRA